MEKGTKRCAQEQLQCLSLNTTKRQAVSNGLDLSLDHTQRIAYALRQESLSQLVS